MVFFCLKHVLNDALSVYYGKSKSRNEIIEKMGGCASSWAFLMNFIFGVYLVIYLFFTRNDLEERRLRVYLLRF